MIDLIDLDEVEKRIGVSYPTLKKHIESGELARPRVLNGKMVWTLDELVTFVDQLPKHTPRGPGRPRGRRDLVPRKRRSCKNGDEKRL